MRGELQHPTWWDVSIPRPGARGGRKTQGQNPHPETRRDAAPEIVSVIELCSTRQRENGRAEGDWREKAGDKMLAKGSATLSAQTAERAGHPGSLIGSRVGQGE